MAKKSRIPVDESIDFSQIAAEIKQSSVTDFIHTNFLPYSYYVIMNRALISEDGLKPVNRRILYTMYEQGITHKKSHVKASAIGGNTMSNYHPHGDASITDALARMAQGFVMRVPLIDPYGEVGQVSGDRASAPRYWEARMTEAAVELVREVDDKAVPLGKNYDGTRDEPAVLPIRWPNGIINGSQGIAVGYACQIFPHNPTEVMDAIIAYIKNPEMNIDQLIEIMPGPDMPTGGQLLGKEAVKEYYETGKGTFTIRGKYEIKPLPRGAHEIIFYELPYQVSVENVREAIRDAQNKKGVLKGIAEHKDLSDMNRGLRFYIRTKSGVNPNMVVKELFKHTPAEQKFSSNMTVLYDKIPNLVSMFTLFDQFIQFRRECIVNRSQARLAKVDSTVARLEGIMKVIVDVDKAIKIIRNADTAEIASTQLQTSFKITEEQAGHILSMQLRRLTKADNESMVAEIKKLREEQVAIREMLSNEDTFKAAMIAELEETKAIIADERRTTINEATAEEIAAEEKALKKDITASAKNTECYITMFTDGTVTRTETPYTQKPPMKGIVGSFKTKALEQMIAITKDGSGYRVPVTYVPQDLHSDIEILGIREEIVGLGRIDNDRSDHGMLVATNKGNVNIISGGYPSGEAFVAVKLEEGEEVILATHITKQDNSNRNLLLASADGYVVHFPISEIRTSNSGAGTIKGMGTDEEVIGASVVDKSGSILSCSTEGIKVTELSELPDRKRGAKGVILHKLRGDDKLLYVFASSSKAIIATKNGKAIKLPEANARAAAGDNRGGKGVIAGHHSIP